MSISEFLELYPELREYDTDIVLLALEIYNEDAFLDIDEFILSIK